MQLLDQGINLFAKRRYKKKLAERYLVCVKNSKDANTLLRSLDIVQTTRMTAASWRETPTIFQNCFCKAGFKHHAVDPSSQPEEPPIASDPNVWSRVQKWLGDVEFDEFTANKPEAPTTQPISVDYIIGPVHTENDPQEESEDEEDEIPSATTIKNFWP